MAKLYFEYGSMGAQKTARLLATAFNYEEHGGRVVVTKPSVDTKGDTTVVSRIGLNREVDFLATPEMDIQDEIIRRGVEKVRGENKSINAVLVDEAQFLQPAQVDQLFSLAVVHYIPVLTYGLRTDFQTNSFPGSRRLMEIAHEIRESIGMCAAGDGCEKKAMFNARQIDGEYVAEGDQVAIDGQGETTYKALCGKHYLDSVGTLPGLALSAIKRSA
jgi:thymidine kinase